MAEDEPGPLEPPQGGEGRRQVGPAGEVVVQPADRHRPHLHRLVVEQADSGPGERPAGGGGVAPMVVIAEHGDGGEPRAQRGQRRDRLVVRIITGGEPLVGDEVAGDEDDVGRRGG